MSNKPKLRSQLLAKWKLAETNPLMWKPRVGRKGHDQAMLSRYVDNKCPSHVTFFPFLTLSPYLNWNNSSFFWGLAKEDSIAHDSYHCQRFTSAQPWPTKRIMNQTNNFVGGAHNGWLDKVCPEICRPPAHMDWEMC